MAVWFLYIAVAAILTCGHSLPSAGQRCQNFTPPTNVRGVNRLDRSSDLPLFRLKIFSHSPTNSSGQDPKTYRVEVFAENEQFPFSDAKISMTTKDPCQTGSLTFDPQHFLETRQSGHACHVLQLINRKVPAVALPSLTWKPPVCGCVQFRAVVTSVDNAYYVDNDDVENGPLSQTICSQQKVSRELYLNVLCHVREKYSAAEIISRPSFVHRHQLEARWMDKHGLEMGLELRRSDNRLCCSKSSLEAKLACFDDARRRRVDRFCEDGYPDIPFTSFRLHHMRERERRCCFLLGEHRYSCFAEKSGLIPGPKVTPLDFSLDETDPVNDLAEFASIQDADVVQTIEALAFGDKGSKDNTTKIEHDKKETDNDKEKVADEMKDKQVLQLVNEKKRVQAEGMKSNLDISSELLETARDSQTEQRLSSTEVTRTTTKVTSETERPTLTSFENLKKTGRSREIDRRSSGERASSRRASSREYTSEGRRASGERTARKRGSAERIKPVSGAYSWSPGYENTYSRGTGLSREREPISSAERRKWARTSAQRGQDWLEVDEPDFEDQGGKSVEVTLDKLQKKMERLQLRHHCCKAGAVSGRLVYGWFYNVRKECENSKEKYISGNRIRSGVKVCHDEFLKCCREVATSGPVATSSEFKDNQFLFMDNLQRVGRVRGASQLERQDDDWEQAAGGLHQDGMSRDIPGHETFEDYELESDRRFKSMRDVDGDLKEVDDDDEYNGPRRFDETDNDMSKEVDILDRKDETLNKDNKKTLNTTVKNKGNDGTGEFDEKIVANIKEAEKSGEIQTDSSNENKKQKLGSGSNEKSKRKQNRQGNKDQLDRVSDRGSNLETSREDSLLAKTSGGRSGYLRNSQGEGRSQGGKSSSRESRYRSAMKGSRTTKPPEHPQTTQSYQGNRGGYKTRPSGKIGTEDSQEMAAAHVRKFMATLDSKEMVDAYKRKNADASDLLNDAPVQPWAKKRKHHRQRWYY